MKRQEEAFGIADRRGRARYHRSAGWTMALRERVSTTMSAITAPITSAPPTSMRTDGTSTAVRSRGLQGVDKNAFKHGRYSAEGAARRRLISGLIKAVRLRDKFGRLGVRDGISAFEVEQKTCLWTWRLFANDPERSLLEASSREPAREWQQQD